MLKKKFKESKKIMIKRKELKRIYQKKRKIFKKKKNKIHLKNNNFVELCVIIIIGCDNMISKIEKERQLIESGMFDAIKNIFLKRNVQISDKYLMLITDYIDALGQLDPNDGLYLDPIQVAQSLPSLLKNVQEEELGVYGITDNYTIKMNSRNDYETNKLFFFHELTHAIQTK